jgi:hypothetical protein
VEVGGHGFGMRCFAGTACIEIADTNNRDRWGSGLEPTLVVGQISKPHNESVDP